MKVIGDRRLAAVDVRGEDPTGESAGHRGLGDVDWCLAPAIEADGLEQQHPDRRVSSGNEVLARTKVSTP